MVLIAVAAGGAGNLAQWVVLGGVSNPIGPLPGVHGRRARSIGDACLWLAVPLALCFRRYRDRAAGPGHRQRLKRTLLTQRTPAGRMRAVQYLGGGQVVLAWSGERGSGWGG